MMLNLSLALSLAGMIAGPAPTQRTVAAEKGPKGCAQLPPMIAPGKCPEAPPMEIERTG